jgi:hypothetical protein
LVAVSSVGSVTRPKWSTNDGVAQLSPRSSMYFLANPYADGTKNAAYIIDGTNEFEIQYALTTFGNPRSHGPG